MVTHSKNNLLWFAHQDDHGINLTHDLKIWNWICHQLLVTTAIRISRTERGSLTFKCIISVYGAFMHDYLNHKLKLDQSQVILFLKSMSEIGGSDIDFEDKTAWVWTTLNIEIELLSVFTMFIYGNDWLRGDVSWCDWNIFSLPIVESNNIRKPWILISRRNLGFHVSS